MRHSKALSVLSAVAFTTVLAAVGRADFTYNFDTVTGSSAPGTPLNSDPTIGAFGQDNWVLASGVSSYVRNDPMTGFSGNWLAGAPADATTTTQDSITTRAGANLGVGGNRYATFQFDGLIGTTYNNTAGNPVYRRSELAPGIDANLDGDIRGTSLSSENSEVAFQFGYESSGSGWYVRRTSYSNTGTITSLFQDTGVYTMQLVVDFQANPTASGVPDGAGTLYVKKLADAAGNPVDDVFRVASPTTINVNLGISAMGTFGAADPANWNGMSMRTAGNGGLDNINFRAGLPTTSSIWAADAGNWLSSGSWYLSIPNAVDAVAEFTAGARVNSTVYADDNVTVGTIVFNNSHSYNVSGNGTLTLQTSTGSAQVNVQNGSHKLNLPLVVASNTTLNVASGSTLRISDPMTINAGRTVTQSGAGQVLYESSVTLLSAANLTVGNSTYMNNLTLTGTARTTVAAHGSGARRTLTLDGHSFDTGSTLDLTDNALHVRAADTAIRGEIIAGKIVSSLASSSRSLGYVDAGSGFTDVAYTLKGDTNLTFAVDFDDLLSLAQNYGLSSNATWFKGDFDYSGLVNFDDLLALAQNYGSTLLSDGTLAIDPNANFTADWALARSMVPEPVSMSLLTASALIARRRRA